MSYRTIPTIPAAVLAIALAGCGSPSEVDPAETGVAETAAGPRQAVAALRTADGAAAGTVTVTEGADGLSLLVNATGLPVGERGVHVHMTGACEGPAFESAGSHWNPGERRHGLDAPDGPHAGDMPNLTVQADGTGVLEYILRGGTFAQLLDADGAAFVVHAAPDDQITDPSGNSGDRIACGVFAEQAAVA